ncbi:MAG TPA: carboxypeptidase-like regulatory domain-containing protein [Vicinamibacterales bacterium]|nr:carboxypeptidase-like regulatory domain-containing protein [Vicinamibacterales bacterium]
MRLSRYGGAVAVAGLLAAACGGTPPPVVRPGTASPATAPADPASDRIVITTDTPVAGTGVISGRIVTDDDPPRAIARARVILTADTLPDPRVVITGADGAFSFEKVPPGSYTLTASASGYAPQYYGARRAGPPAPVVLGDGQRADALEIVLPRAGVIVGQVMDEDDRPFVGAIVDALVSRTEEGRPMLVSLSSATTDDRGEFRLTGLPAGQYYVSALDPAFAHVGDHTGSLRYTATYYPGVLFVEQATRVSVVPGVEPDLKIAFKLQIVRPATVSGIIATPDRKQLMSGAVIMSPVHGEALASIPSDDVRILPDGSFTFRNVAPGMYQIRARAELDPYSVALFATYRLRVHGRDIRNVEMLLLPGATVNGTVQYEAVATPRPPTFTGIRVRAPFSDGSIFGDALTGDVTPSGNFSIRGLMSGTHYITVEGLDYPWVLRRVLWRGQDITDVAIDVQSQELVENVQITLTDVTSDVSGTVRDAKGRPAADALVMIIPLAQHFWTRTSRRFALTYTDANGRYRVRGLPAGDYRAVASVEFDESEIYRTEILNQFVAEGMALALADREARTVNLGLTALSTLGRTRTP